jgi:hypothetical protein
MLTSCSGTAEALLPKHASVKQQFAKETSELYTFQSK